eukprot:124618-Pyramimonas_sp.AAC.1
MGGVLLAQIHHQRRSGARCDREAALFLGAAHWARSPSSDTRTSATAWSGYAVLPLRSCPSTAQWEWAELGFSTPSNISNRWDSLAT